MNGLEVKACINKHASCVFSSHFLPSVHDNNNIFIYTEKTYLFLLLTYLSWEHLWTSITFPQFPFSVSLFRSKQVQSQTAYFFVIIVTSQVDLSSKRVVGSKDAQKWAKAHDLRFVCLPLVF